jgi:flagellar hook-associated protein 2
MASFSIGGIVSGLDTNSIIDSLVAAASTPKTVMAAKKAKVEKLQTAYEELSSRLTDMQTALEAIDTAEEFRSLSGTSTNEDVASVTVDGDGVVGTYNLTVTQLADSAMLVTNDLFADADTTNVGLTGDSITVTYAGTATVITLASNQTLEELAATINEEVDGVTAYVMNTGSGYKLVYSGEDTGASNTLTVTGATGTLATSFAGGTTTAATAQDALVSINGVSLSSESNSLSDVIQGVTFDLEETGSTKVTVGVDEDAMTEKISTFVDAYNSVITYVGSQSIYDADSDTKGIFIGETVVSRLLANMKAKLSTNFETSSSDPIGALAEIGFKTLQSGKIEFDESAFKDALADNLDQVTGLFIDDFVPAMTDFIDSNIDDTDGIVSNRLDSLGDIIDGIAEDISDFEDRMDAYEARLKKNFTAMEIALGKLQTAQDSLSALLSTTSSSSKK